MSTNTTNMALGKGVDGDNTKTYVETTLAGALDTIDAHDHSADAKGLAVGRLGATTTVSGGDTLTWPTTAQTMVGRTTTDTLTNKTLTAPAINGTVTTSGLTLPAVTLGGAVTGGSQNVSALGTLGCGAITTSALLTVSSGGASITGGVTAAGASNVYVNDDANAKMTTGLTINQGAADDEIVALKSSDIAHGMTDLAETDTFGFLQKGNATAGGLYVSGFTDGDEGAGFGYYALYLQGVQGRAAETTHTAAGAGVVGISASVKSTTTKTAVGTDGNLFSVANNGSTKFLIDAEGNFFSDDTGSTYDDYDDLALVQAFDLRAQFGQWRGANRDTLIAARVLAPDDDQGNRGFVNWTNLLRLHNGALRQMYAALEAAQERVAALEARLLALAGPTVPPEQAEGGA